MKKYFLLFAGLIFFLGCKTNENTSLEVEFPAWKRLMSLTEKPKNVTKTIWYDGKSEQRDVEFSEKTFKILKEINPNESKYFGAFEITKKTNTKILKLKDNQNFSLKYLEMIFDEKGQINAFEAKLNEKTFIYQFEKQINGKIINGKWNFIEEKVFQKVIFRDSTKFHSKTVFNY